MVSKISTLALVGMCFGSLSATASVPSIVGTWDGTHENTDPTNSSFDETSPMLFIVQSQSGTAISGEFDWLSGAAAGCPRTPCTTTWSGTISSSGQLSIVGEFGDEFMANLGAANSLSGTFTAPASLPDNGFGVWSVSESVQAPEIDPASAASALTLLLGGLAVLKGRRGLQSP